MNHQLGAVADPSVACFRHPGGGGCAESSVWWSDVHQARAVGVDAMRPVPGGLLQRVLEGILQFYCDCDCECDCAVTVTVTVTVL